MYDSSYLKTQYQQINITEKFLDFPVCLQIQFAELAEVNILWSTFLYDFLILKGTMLSRNLCTLSGTS
jgi:hypothetical protein